MKVLLIGNKGQLGREFEMYLSHTKTEFIGLDLPEFDVSNFHLVMATLDSYRPDYIINCSAYNFVDQAEENRWDATRVNTIGVNNLVIAAQKFNSFLIHYSTNYVFDGRKKYPYSEEDNPHPINFYGLSKYLGEQAIQNQMENFLIFRTSWLYGMSAQNFIYKFLGWASKSDTIYIVQDELGVPTSTRTVVAGTIQAIENRITGLYHLVNSGYCSRYDWALIIASVFKLDCRVLPARMREFSTKARRPKFGVLSNELISKKLHLSIPSWDKELEEYLIPIKNFFTKLNN